MPLGRGTRRYVVVAMVAIALSVLVQIQASRRSELSADHLERAANHVDSTLALVHAIKDVVDTTASKGDVRAMKKVAQASSAKAANDAIERVTMDHRHISRLINALSQQVEQTRLELKQKDDSVLQEVRSRKKR